MLSRMVLGRCWHVSPKLGQAQSPQPCHLRFASPCHLSPGVFYPPHLAHEMFGLPSLGTTSPLLSWIKRNARFLR